MHYSYITTFQVIGRSNCATLMAEIKEKGVLIMNGFVVSQLRDLVRYQFGSERCEEKMLKTYLLKVAIQLYSASEGRDVSNLNLLGTE